MRLLVTSRLSYELDEPTDFVFQVHAAKTGSQSVASETFSISTNPPVDLFEVPGALNRVARSTLGPGQVVVDYRAEVEVVPRQFDAAVVREFDFPELPAEVLAYLLPSRFCPSDLFNELVAEQFASMPRGCSRASAIADWVHGNLAYFVGSTGPHTTAADAFQQRKGVCRDFAHVAISLCRAAGIPARYVSAYADALSPPDFHAIVEVYLLGPESGAWFMLDPTHMSSADAVARIAAGRDAADVAFAWTLGDVDSTAPEVTVAAPGRVGTGRTGLAVAGA